MVGSCEGQRRLTLGRMRLDSHTLAGADLAGADIGDAVHRGEAARTVAPEAQRAPSPGMDTGPDEGREEGVARLDRDLPSRVVEACAVTHAAGA